MQQPYGLSLDEFPPLELYMDQVIVFVNQQLNLLTRSENEITLTASMVNNYVKAKVVDRPERKKYRPEQLADLIMVSVLKNVLTLNEIKDLFSWREHVGMPLNRCYDIFRAELCCEDKNLPQLYEFSKMDNATAEVSDETAFTNVLRRVLRSFCQKKQAMRDLATFAARPKGDGTVKTNGRHHNK